LRRSLIIIPPWDKNLHPNSKRLADCEKSKGYAMGKRKHLRHKIKTADKSLLDAVERSNRLISQLLGKIDLTDEERASADVISMELLREAVALFAAARAEARQHGVHLRIRVAQAALAAALQGIMIYPAEGDE
jgi:hypothetical protein